MEEVNETNKVNEIVIDTKKVEDNTLESKKEENKLEAENEVKDGAEENKGTERNEGVELAVSEQTEKIDDDKLETENKVADLEKVVENKKIKCNLLEDKTYFLCRNKNVYGSSLDTAKLVGIYFSAHWCPSSRKFTPLLPDFYNNVNRNGHVFEIIFSSCDQYDGTFQKNAETMPWIHIPLNDSNHDKLVVKYKVSGIPRLVIVNPKNLKEPVINNAKDEVLACQEVSLFEKWLSSINNEGKEGKEVNVEKKATKVNLEDEEQIISK